MAKIIRGICPSGDVPFIPCHEEFAETRKVLQFSDRDAKWYVMESFADGTVVTSVGICRMGETPYKVFTKNHGSEKAADDHVDKMKAQKTKPHPRSSEAYYRWFEK